MDCGYPMSTTTTPPRPPLHAVLVPHLAHHKLEAAALAASIGVFLIVRGGPEVLGA